jgi:hypothetical protein
MRQLHADRRIKETQHVDFEEAQTLVQTAVL